MNLPERFLIRMKERLGAQFPAFLSSYGTPPARALRVNTLKISAEEFVRRAPFPLGERVDGARDSFYLGEGKFGADPYHFAGLYYLQEPSATTVGEAAADCRKGRVLDLCAAPGGKTTHIAAQMAGEGLLISNETDYRRAKILAGNVGRMGITNCAVVSAPPAEIAARFAEFFDLVLVDAPCSGEGMFKKEENAVREWSEKNVARCAARQREILAEAAKTVAEGGRLLYSTCTFAEEEDEWQAEDFLREHPEFSLLSVRKLYPHTFRGEGHFCALFEKTRSLLSPARLKGFPACGDGAARAFRAFSEDFFADTPRGKIVESGGRLFLAPQELPDLAGLAVLRAGVEAGEWDGRLFKPAHALAMAFGRSARRKVHLTREEAKKYLCGDTVKAEIGNGWCVVCVEEFPLGLGKCVDGVVKNHLPKGLRLFDRRNFPNG